MKITSVFSQRFLTIIAMCLAVGGVCAITQGVAPSEASAKTYNYSYYGSNGYSGYGSKTCYSGFCSGSSNRYYSNGGYGYKKYYSGGYSGSKVYSGFGGYSYYGGGSGSSSWGRYSYYGW